MTRRLLTCLLALTTLLACADDPPEHDARLADDASANNAATTNNANSNNANSNNANSNNANTDPTDADPTDADPTDTDPTDPPPDTPTDPPDAPTDPPTPAFAWSSPPTVSLPYAVAGQPVPTGRLQLRATGQADATAGATLEHLTGPFAVTGDLLTPLAAGTTRDLDVRFTGDATLPAIHQGAVDVTIDGQRRTVELFAVLGDARLGASRWTQQDYASQDLVTLPSAPFPHPSGPWTDQHVLLALPDGFSDRSDVGVVLHLHGHNAELPTTADNQHLVAQHGLAGRDAVLVIPQGPVRAASGNFGKLVEPGGLDALLRDVLSCLYRDGRITRPVMAELVLTAHSGGYVATAQLLDLHQQPVLAVHLLDALYASERTFGDYARSGGTLRSLYTSGGGTDDNNLALAATFRADGLAFSTSAHDGALYQNTINLAWAPFAHNPVTYAERNFARLLAASGLTRTALAPPELLATLASLDPSRTRVLVRQDPGGWPTPVHIEGSEDGRTWTLLTTSETGDATVPSHPWLRLTTDDPAHGASLASDRYGATGTDWLIVDGFDRVFGGSWDVPTHGFAAAVANSLTQKGFSIASNEAVAEGLVDLTPFDGVIWLLGDESRDDLTFDPEEQARLDAWLDAGGHLIISGSEVGFATETLWFTNTLHATYVRDSAATTHVHGATGDWTFGVAYPEDFPDVLAGPETLWTYDTGGAAAVGWNRQIVVVGFPLETLADGDRQAAMAELIDWFGP